MLALRYLEVLWNDGSLKICNYWMTWVCQTGEGAANLTDFMNEKKTESTKSHAPIKFAIEVHLKWYDASGELDGAAPQPVEKTGPHELLYCRAQEAGSGTGSACF